jgi:membrane associated rhomboid family serine protease
MKEYFEELDRNISSALSPVVKYLFYACIAVFLVTMFAPRTVFTWLAARPATTLLGGQVWQLLTYAFVHANFPHLFFNLLSIYFFGVRLEQRWGSETFFRFVVAVAAGAVATHLAVALIVGQPDISIVGISGVVYGVLFAYAYYYPDDTIFLYFMLPMKVKYFVAILGLFTLMASAGSGGGGVAHLTHLGGLMTGFLFVRAPATFAWIPVPPVFRRGATWGREYWR